MRGLCKVAGELARLRDTSGHHRGRTNPWRVLAVAVVVAGAVMPDAAATDARRAVLGTVVAPGTLELSSDPQVWTPAAVGSPVLEETTLRTGSDKKATLSLGQNGVIGVHEDSRVRIGALAAPGLPVSLEGDSGISFRLPDTTTLSIFTDVAIVTGPDAGTSSVEPWIHGTISQRGDETVIRVVEGTLRVRNRATEEFALLTSGQEARIAASDTLPRVAAMTDASAGATRGRLPAFLGTTTGMVVAGAVAVGGSLGGAAAAGAFDGSGSSSAQAVDDQPSASPFRP